MKKILTNWGRYPVAECEAFRPSDYAEVATYVRQHTDIIARGNGRCYGDASLASRVISTLSLDRILAFNRKEGIITCQAGVLLDAVLKRIVPEGYFLPVTPGTKLITVGGALAADIHGKNHHTNGVFSDHVLSFRLLTSDGNISEVKPGEPLFDQTAGGLGRTGIILELTFRLMKMETAYLRQTVFRAKNLTEIIGLLERHSGAAYSVAWIDCLATGRQLGRSILYLGEHTAFHEVPGNKNALQLHNPPQISIPFLFPSWILNPVSMRVFNFLYFHKASTGKSKVVHYDPFFYPLDKLKHWNRMYGKNGFVQYQFVLPLESAYEGISSIIEILSSSGLSPFLAVIKGFGKSHDRRYLHFPMEGYTLALDIKISAALWTALDRTDNIVSRLGGRVYLTKDARMKREAFLAQYTVPVPETPTFKSHQMERFHRKKEHVLLILGANSDIANATAIAYARQNPSGHLILASRDLEQLTHFASEQGLTSRCDILYFDAADLNTHRAFVETLPQQPDWVLYTAGVLIANETGREDPSKWRENAAVNFTGAVSVLQELVRVSNPFLKRIMGLSSIAALRGRRSNYLYGAAKSGFHQYLCGLRQELQSRGICVQAITPGSVRTKMTQHMHLPPGTNTPEEIAASILQSQNCSFEVYPTLFWRFVAIVVRILPEWALKRI